MELLKLITMRVVRPFPWVPAPEPKYSWGSRWQWQTTITTSIDSELCVNKNMAFEWCLTNTTTVVIYSWPSIVNKIVIALNEYLKCGCLREGIISKIDFEDYQVLLAYRKLSYRFIMAGMSFYFVPFEITINRVEMSMLNTLSVAFVYCLPIYVAKMVRRNQFA